MKELNLKIGADPEVMLFKNGKPISAIGKIKGTKDIPFKISKEGHSVQVDNVLLEFNVPPADNAKDMFKNIEFVLNWFKNHFDESHSIEIRSSVIYPKEELAHPDALKFGCDPDYDAWIEDVNPAPSPDTQLRSAGGHIHVSYPDPEMRKSLEMVKLFDLFLGVPSIIKDDDAKRRILYGKAGAFRFKNYPGGKGGFEYRTLSNFWIKDLESVKFIFNQIKKAFKAYENGLRLKYDSHEGRQIVNAINTSNVNVAKYLIKKYKI
jgi:hypothetical protein